MLRSRSETPAGLILTKPGMCRQMLTKPRIDRHFGILRALHKCCLIMIPGFFVTVLGWLIGNDLEESCFGVF